MVHNNMCMKNVNAIANIDALDESRRVVSEINGETMEKKIPLESVKELLVSFSASIINGTEKFFTKYHKLYFQLRITDENGNSNSHLVLNEYCLDMEDESKYHKTALVDYIYFRDMFILNFDTNDIEKSKEYNLNVLIKTEQDIDENNGWTIQSVIPLNFI